MMKAIPIPIPIPTSETFIQSLTIIAVPESRRMSSSCAICHEKLSGTVTWLPCDHCFHRDCVVPLIRKVNTCPLCHHVMPAEEDGKAFLAAVLLALEEGGSSLDDDHQYEAQQQLVDSTDGKAASLPPILTGHPEFYLRYLLR